MDRRRHLLAGTAAVTGLGLAWLGRHRSSPAVRGWAAPVAGSYTTTGSLQVRVAGRGDQAVVLLHGLVASGDSWGRGYDRLADGHRLIVPDLLGFGGSLDTARGDFARDAHLEALDDLATQLGLDGRPLIIVGHSMGAVLGLSWAARRPETARVVCFGAPLYDCADEAISHIAAMGTLERLFALEGPLAHSTCRWMCAHREAAAILAVLLKLEWPVQLARQGVLHTWPAYLGGLRGIIMAARWRDALAELDRRGIDVVLAAGDPDPVPVPGRATALTQQFGCVRAVGHPTAGHDLPISYPAWCMRQILLGTHSTR